MNCQHTSRTHAILVAIAVGLACSAQAQTITKSDTATMNTADDWGGTAPDGTKIGLFDSTLATQYGSLNLGGPVSLMGMLFTNSLVGPVVVNADGNALTNGASGIDMSSANQNVTLDCDLVASGAQVWTVGNNSTALTLTVGGNVSGSVPALNLTTNTTLIFNSATTPTVSVDAAAAVIKNNNTTGIPTVSQAPGIHYLSQVNGVNGATIVLSGVPNCTNYVVKQFNTAGMLAKFNGGTWNLINDGGFAENFELDSGVVINTNRNCYFNQGNATFTIHGGTMIMTNAYGLRLGTTFGANNTSVNFTGVQDGGGLLVSKGSMELGGNSGTTDSYTLSGGSVSNLVNLNIGADTAGAGTTTFTLGGTGKLWINATFAGSQATGAKQIFAFNGGTMVAKTFDATKIASPKSPTTQGTLVNNGGRLAPGDIGTPGKTTITGSYTINSGTLAIDIGGTTQASAFQDTVAKYDFVSVSGTATLGGLATASLINSYTPGATNAFTILTAGTSIVGTNTSIGYSGYVPVTLNGVPQAGKYFQAVVVGKNLILTNYGAALPALTASFTPTNSTGTPPLPVSFTDTSSGAITNRHWNFGDTTTLDTLSTSVSHTFTNLGVYTVVLTVSGANGATASSTGKVSVVTAGGTLTWTGARSSEWDLATTNWVDALSTPYVFAQADGVVFDDTPVRTNVTLNFVAAPNSVDFNNSVNQYTVNGMGKISAGTGLNVNNYGGLVTLLTTNDYAGPTTIASGATLELGNGSVSGSIDNTAYVANNGTLVVNTPDNHTLNGSVDGNGSIIKAGAGTFGMPNGILNGTVTVTGGKFSTTDYTNIPGTSAFSVSGGGVYEFTAGPSSYYQPFVFGPGGGGMNHSAAVDVYNVLTGTGPFIKGGAGTMTLYSANDYTGGTIINGGTIDVADPATLGANSQPLTMAAGAILNYNTSVSQTNTPVDAAGATINNKNLNATITVVQTAGAHGLGAFTGVSGVTNVFAGDAAAVTTLGGVPGVSAIGGAGVTAKFTGGMWINTSSGQQPANVEIDGGNLIWPPGGIDSQWKTPGQTLVIHSGSLISSNNYGLRIANTYGVTAGNPASGPFTGLQDGGLLLSASGDGLQWGSTICTGFFYTLSGGTIQILAGMGPLNLGADTNGGGPAIFTLTNTGKLLAGGNWGGASSVQGAVTNPAALQVFAFDGGTLAAYTFNATYLRPTVADPEGTLVNNGGRLAPGDVGVAGQTVITGNYVVNNSASVLDIDLGGTTAANAFQVLSNDYDAVVVNGNVTLGGSLNLRLINGFEPMVSANNSFVVLRATNTLTGAFSNVASGSRLAVTGYPNRSFRVTVTSTNVVLDQYQTDTPQASFTGSPTSGAAPLTVTFTDHSNGSLTNRAWNFGDGNTTNTTATSLVHTYTTANRTNTVTLTVNGALGSSTQTRTNYIIVNAPAEPPQISSITQSGGNITVAGTGGVAGGNYVVLASTNVVVAMPAWMPVQTNQFGPGGVFSFTIILDAAKSADFFRIEVQ